ncbi:MAG: hypothetical protein SXA11_14700, partial [Cyanobacteriota bacterium]|nr:hypothetical protein [Cyanobacteriota bacterium]
MTETNSQQLLPGQIWELDRSLNAPLEFSPQDRQRLYPETARRFLAGEGLPRYVAIAKEPERAIAERPGGLLAPEEPWAVLQVLLLSPETDRLSDINILIPSAISGMGRDLLALTGRVLPMLSCNLSRLVGRRLSPSVCHALLNRDRSDDSNLASIESLGLGVGSSESRLLPEMQEFHRRESEFAAVLEVPVAAYRTYEKAIAISEVLLDLAFEVESEFLEEESPKPQNPPHPDPLRAIELQSPPFQGGFRGIEPQNPPHPDPLRAIELQSPPFQGGFRGIEPQNPPHPDPLRAIELQSPPFQGGFRGTEPQNPPHPDPLTAIRLSQWLEDIVESGWQKLEYILPKSPETPAFNFRSITPKTKSNGKLVELGEKPDAVKVALSAELTPISG